MKMLLKYLVKLGFTVLALHYRTIIVFSKKVASHKMKFRQLTDVIFGSQKYKSSANNPALI